MIGYPINLSSNLYKTLTIGSEFKGGAYVYKEKLKLLKKELKAWSMEKYRDLEGKKSFLIQQTGDLDKREEEGNLSIQEVAVRSHPVKEF